MAGPIDEILSTTVKAWVDSTAHDNIFKTHALFYSLKKNNAIRPFTGERIVAGLEYASNATVAWTGKAGTVSLVEQDVITSSEWNWKLLSGSVVLYEFDLRRNKGEAQMINYAETKTKNAVKSMRESLLTATFATSQDALQPTNWQSIFRSTGTVGGINQTTYTWWAANYDNTAEPLTVEDMFDMYNLSSGGSDPPKVVVTSRVLFQKYNSLLQAQQRFTDSDMANAGFTTLKFHNANVIWDEQAIADEVWFWNPDYLFWGTLPEQVGTFEVDPFEPLQDQVGKRSLIWTMGEVH